MTPAKGRPATVALVERCCTQAAGHPCLAKAPFCSVCGPLKVPSMGPHAVPLMLPATKLHPAESRDAVLGGP